LICIMVCTTLAQRLVRAASANGASLIGSP
jgi:hypothetical protein